MKKIIIFVTIIALCFISVNCTRSGSHSKGVFMLLDTSGTYRNEINKAHSIIKYLLRTLKPGDSLAVARIDSSSFSEKDIIAKVTLDSRPSYAIQQKRKFKQTIDDFVKNVKSSKYTDISGAILQAHGVFKDNPKIGEKFILIFSDLKEELPAGVIRNLTQVDFNGFKVVALNVTKLRSDNINPQEYLKRKEEWKQIIEGKDAAGDYVSGIIGGGEWKTINDLDNLDEMLK